MFDQASSSDRPLALAILQFAIPAATVLRRAAQPFGLDSSH